MDEYPGTVDMSLPAGSQSEDVQRPFRLSSRGSGFGSPYTRGTTSAQLQDTDPSGSSERDFAVPSDKTSSTVNRQPTVLRPKSSGFPNTVDLLGLEHITTMEQASHNGTEQGHLQHMELQENGWMIPELPSPSINMAFHSWRVEFTWGSAGLLFGNELFETVRPLDSDSAPTGANSDAILENASQSRMSATTDQYEDALDYWLDVDYDELEIEEIEGVDPVVNAYSQEDRVKELVQILVDSYCRSYLPQRQFQKGVTLTTGSRAGVNRYVAPSSTRVCNQPPGDSSEEGEGHQPNRSRNSNNVNGSGSGGGDGSGDGSGDDSGGSSGESSGRSLPGTLLRFACPFSKWRPNEFGKCGPKMKLIGHVKEHLRWAHRERYCPICFKRCTRKKNTMVRQHSVSQCGPPVTMPLDYLSDETYRQLDKYESWGLGPEAHWQEIAKLVLPNDTNHPQRLNPYRVYSDARERLRFVEEHDMVAVLTAELVPSTYTRYTTARLVHQAIQEFLRDDTIPGAVSEESATVGNPSMEAAPPYDPFQTGQSSLTALHGSPVSQNTNSGLSQTLSGPGDLELLGELGPTLTQILHEASPQIQQPSAQENSGHLPPDGQEFQYDQFDPIMNMFPSSNDWEQFLCNANEIMDAGGVQAGSLAEYVKLTSHGNEDPMNWSFYLNDPDITLGETEEEF